MPFPTNPREDEQQDAFAYTIFRYDDDCAALQAEVRAASPNELKHMRAVSTDMLAYLSDDRRFHACFLVQNASKLFAEPTDRSA